MKMFFKRHSELVLIFLSALFLIIAWFVPFPNSIFSVISYLVSYILVAFKVIKRVVYNFLNHNFFDENTLMGVASIGALCLGEFREAVFVMLLYAIGTLLQSKVVNNSRRSIANLMDIQAESANVVIDGVIVNKSLYDIKKGDTLLIKSGDRVAVDAVIIDGQGSFDTSTITGESAVQYLTMGENVISGSVSVGGVVYAKAITDYTDSTVSKILEMVEDATSKKSKTEHFITKFAKVYTPIICIISFLIFIVPFVFGLDPIEWLKKALVFLVLSCPCALVISVPLSFFGGIGALSRKGVLLKGSNYLENLAKTNVVAFDKTGTLTNGEFEIVKIYAKNAEKYNFLSIVYNLEKYSNHSLGKTIELAFKDDENIKELSIENISEIAGYGITGDLNGEKVFAGSLKMMKQNDIIVDEISDETSIIYVAKGTTFLGYISLKDKVRKEAETLVKELKDVGVSKTILLSGDKSVIVKKFASDIGIKEAFGDLLPEDKANKLASLKAEKSTKKVMYVGDGINDAIVITVSDVGVAMGVLGTDISKESADMVIMNDDLSKIPKAIKHAKKVMKIIIENITIALGIKFAILVLDILGLATMGLAVFADVGVTIMAIFNSLRTLK